MDKSKFEGFLEWMKEVETQDNRATQTPILIALQEQDRIYLRSGTGTGEGKAIDVLGKDKCDEYSLDYDEVLYWDDVWKDRQWFFTFSGVKKHLELNAHNYRKETTTYVHALAYRNPEMVKLFEWLRALKEELEKQ